VLSNVSNHRLTRLLVSVLTTGLMTLGATTVTVSSASADEFCWNSLPTENGEGGGYTITSINLKKGPYAACDNVASVADGKLVWLQCTTTNIYGNYWWYVRVAGTSTYGWTSYNNIADHWIDDDGDGNYEITAC